MAENHLGSRWAPRGLRLGLGLRLRLRLGAGAEAVAEAEAEAVPVADAEAETGSVAETDPADVARLFFQRRRDMQVALSRTFCISACTCLRQVAEL